MKSQKVKYAPVTVICNFKLDPSALMGWSWKDIFDA